MPPSRLFVPCSLRSHGQPVFWIPPPIQWADGAIEPRARDRSSLSGAPEPHLIWVDYGHNTPPSPSTGFSPFHFPVCLWLPATPVTCNGEGVSGAHCYSHGPPLPPLLGPRLLVKNFARFKRMADHRRTPAPNYCVGQRVWLSTRDLPLRIKSSKLAPWCVGPFPISKVICTLLFLLCFLSSTLSLGSDTSLPVCRRPHCSTCVFSLRLLLVWCQFVS